MSKTKKAKKDQGKGTPIQRWRPTYPKLSEIKLEPKYDLVIKSFDSLKNGWVIQYENEFWRIVSIHTNNILKIKLLSKNNRIQKTINLTEATVRFIQKQKYYLSSDSGKSGSNSSITMDFDKLYGKKSAVSGGLPTLGKRK